MVYKSIKTKVDLKRTQGANTWILPAQGSVVFNSVKVNYSNIQSGQDTHKSSFSEDFSISRVLISIEIKNLSFLAFE